MYFHAKSDHPPNIIKELPISIKSRISNLAGNVKIFDEIAKLYEYDLNQSRYNYKFPVQTFYDYK